MSAPVSRSSNPLSAAYRGVAQLFLISMSASLADQRRTDEVSNPDWANHLPGHPASFALSAPSALRSPAPGLAIGAHSLGSIPGGNLVGLAPQSKCFFSYQECG